MAKAVKKAVRKKRKERKNIEKANTHSVYLNNTLVTLTDLDGKRTISGQVLTIRIQRDQENQHHSSDRWSQKKRQVLWSMV